MWDLVSERKKDVAIDCEKGEAGIERKDGRERKKERRNSLFIGRLEPNRTSPRMKKCV